MADTLLQKTLRQISESLSDGGEQGLPTEQPLIAQAVADEAYGLDPMLTAYFKKIGVDAAMAATFSPDFMKQMAYAARQDAYETARQAELQRTGNLQRLGASYAEANPQDYYNTFGTIPLLSLGKSRFGIDPKTGTWDTAQGAEGFKSLTPDETATYTLYSPRSGQTLGTGSGAQGLLSLAQMASRQTVDKDRKADWQLIKTPAGGGTPEVIASNLYNSDLTTLGKIVAAGLPIATAFIPGLNLATAIATGAGAGGLSAAMQDQNILKGALLGGATAGIMKAPILNGGKTLEGVIGGALNKVPVVGDTLRGIGNALDLPAAAQRAAAQKASTDIVVNAATKAVPKVLSGGIGSLANLANTAPTTQGPDTRRPDYGDKVEPDTGEPGTTVVGQRLDRAVNIIANGGTLADVINAGYTIDEFDAALNKYQSEEPGTTVVGEKPAPAPIPSFTPGPTDNVALPQDEIVVTRKNETPVTGIDAIINSVAPSLNAPTMDVPAQAPDKGMSVGDYIRLAGLGASVLGALGGGGGGGSSLSTSGGGALNFTPTNRSFTGGGIGGGAGGSFDPFTYGQALPGAQTAEYLFFQPAANAGYQTTPAMAAPEAMPAYKDGGEVDDDMVRHLVEWHKGGGHTGPGKVKGIGSGQEDLIPAWLSDGEYVWSAQDVADLGDGSTDEGVRRLDKMRQMVRRRAGRKDVKKIAKPQRGIDTMLKAVGGSV